MTKQLFKNMFGWGIALWFIGYALSIALFMVVPPDMLGWVIMPVGIAITLWVLLKKITQESFAQYIVLAVVWTLIAVVFDYFFIVKLFHPADGYYKLDVYLYYAFTFVMPYVIGWRKSRNDAAEITPIS